MTVANGTLAGGPVVDDTIVAQVTYNLSESAGFSDTWGYQYIAGSGGLSETVRFSTAFAFQGVYHTLLAEAVRVSVAQIYAASLQMAEAFNLTSAFAPAYGHLIVEALKITQTSFTTATMSLSLTQAMTLVEALNQVGGVSLSDETNLSDPNLIYNYIAGAGVAELFNLTQDASRLLILQVSLSETSHLTDEGLCNFIYNVGLTEKMFAEITYQQPGETVTTWAINTRTNAVSQYRNFVFNSFASMGRKFIAADQNGLYELNGPRDLTTNVNGEFGGGFFQPAGGKLAGFKGVYIGVSGQGPGSGGTWYLKLIAGDGRTYVYKRASNPNLMKTKIDIGKGLRSTYFAWEACADGQDFNFDEIEFVPMISGRRIG